MIDFHTHILPEMDDGCRNANESIDVIKAMYKSGGRIICATPHYYYTKESIDEFLKRRCRSYDMLTKALEKAQIDVKIILGAETAFFKNMSQIDLERLCYKRTKYLLIEMPFSKWTESEMEELSKIEVLQGIKPILAHVDRYVKLGNKIKRFERLSYPLQINAEALLKFGQRKRCMSLLSTRSGILLGSDCHDRMIRAPNLHLAEKAIADKFGSEKLSAIDRTGRIILDL